MQSKLKLIQEFYIRLYLDQDFCILYEKQKEVHLNNYGFSLVEEKYFPNTNDKSFKAEGFGRRFLIAKEISSRFNNFFCTYLKKDSFSIIDIMESPIYKLFLQSIEFYTRAFCFPHYAGIGPGHENVSKFYYFTQNLILNNEEKFSLMLDISLVLNSQASLSDLIFYQPFKTLVWFNINQDIVIVKNGKWIRIQGSWDQSIPGNIAKINCGELQ